MTDCCFLFYLTKGENNTSCTINLYKKSRNAGATNLKTNTKIYMFLRKKFLNRIIRLWYTAILLENLLNYAIILQNRCFWTITKKSKTPTGDIQLNTNLDRWFVSIIQKIYVPNFPNYANLLNYAIFLKITVSE